MFVYSLMVLFIFGLAIGSFLNVVVYRTIYGESPLSGRSFCPHCKKTISWKYNIPLLSFLWLRGKCAYCQETISWQYPVVEVLTGSLFVWWYLVGTGFFMLVNTPLGQIQPYFWLGIGILLLLVFVFDAWYGVIPNGINLIMFLTVISYRVGLTMVGAMQWNDFVMAVISGFILMMFFLRFVFIDGEEGFWFG